jgi:hypothetical protein
LSLGCYTLPGFLHNCLEAPSVSYGGSSSSTHSLNTKDPQVSILVLLFLLLFIHSLGDVIDSQASNTICVRMTYTFLPRAQTSFQSFRPAYLVTYLLVCLSSSDCTEHMYGFPLKPFSFSEPINTTSIYPLMETKDLYSFFSVISPLFPMPHPPTGFACIYFRWLLCNHLSLRNSHLPSGCLKWSQNSSLSPLVSTLKLE